MKTRSTKTGATRRAKKSKGQADTQLGFDWKKPSSRRSKGKKKSTTKPKSAAKSRHKKGTARKSASRGGVRKASRTKSKTTQRPLKLLEKWYRSGEKQQTRLKEVILSRGGSV